MKKIFFANWKMQLDYRGSLKLAAALKNRFKTYRGEVVICPDFLSVAAVGTTVAKSTLKLGAQDLAAEMTGAYTGEVSAKSLKQAGVKYVLIGHSERRHYQHETNEIIKNKIQAARSVGLIPVLCVGENAAQRRAKKTQAVIRQELEGAVADLKFSDSQSLIVAYEPLWAIGSGRPIEPNEAEAVHVFIKGVLAEIIGQIPHVIYGGSVTSKNAAEFLEWPNIDGLLVGGASLKVDEFYNICKA
jgi:triosephosphate isomerase